MRKLAVLTGSKETAALCAELRSDGLAVVRIDEDDLQAASAADGVIDASHPCEAGVHNALAALCASSGIPLLRFRRAQWSPTDDDTWIDAANSMDARDALRTEWKRVFLCLGHDERRSFAADDRRWYLVRARGGDAVREGFVHCQMTAKAGPFSVESETVLMRENRIDALVTRNAGGEGAFPKIGAARALRLPVVLIRQPMSHCPETAQLEEAVAWARSLCAR